MAAFLFILFSGCSSFSSRDWENNPATSAAEELHYLHESFQRSRYRARLDSEIILLDDAGNIVALLKPGLLVHSPGIDDLDDTDLSDNSRQKILFDLPQGAKITRLDHSKRRVKSQFGKSWFRSVAKLARHNPNQTGQADEGNWLSPAPDP